MVLVGAGPGAAQTCPPAEVSGTVSVGDGSTPSGLPSLSAGHESVGGCCTYQLEGWGSYTANLPYAGNWQFYAGASFYLNSPYSSGASCNYVDSCLTCSGGFGILLYAALGTFSGTVTRLPQNTAGTDWVWTSGGAYAVPDAGGFYKFGSHDPLFDQNNWGLAVAGDGSGPGSGTYTLIAGDQVKEATTTSSQNVDVDFFIWDTSQPPPDIRPSPDPPPGPPEPCEETGEPVSIVSGNQFLDQTDASLPGRGAPLTFTRSYNSAYAGYNAWPGTEAGVGKGWTHSYQKVLTVSPGLIRLTDGDGVPKYFEDHDANGSFKASAPLREQSSFTVAGGTYTRQFRGGGSETYVSPGGPTAYLASITDASGNVVTVTRDPGTQLVAQVADGSGRFLAFSYTNGFLTSLSGPAGPIATYGYTINNSELASVRYAEPAPDTTGYDFEYGGYSVLTAVRDPTGRTLERHTYLWPSGIALTSEIADGREKYTLSYESDRTTVTDANGGATTYHWKRIHGLRRITKIAGPCTSCGGGGGDVQEWEYDDKGRITSHTNGAGEETRYEYDPATGDLLREIDALNQETVYTYDAQGRMLTQRVGDGGHPAVGVIWSTRTTWPGTG
jgi:YD repeat-containing protein